MKDSLHTIIYATVLAVVCAVLLTAAAQFTEPYRKSNAAAEKIRGILDVMEAPFPCDASSRELAEIFEANVRQERQGQLTMYLYAPSGGHGEVVAIAVEFVGPGLWGPVKGFLALEPDMKTIRGIVFHQQEETPGLGGDIVSDSFRNQFKGKTITDTLGNPGIGIVRGGASGANQVDAISGATITCDKVEEMLNKLIGKVTE